MLVTHDQEEAMEVADRIAVMNEGRIEQVGSPREIYDRPTSEFVMSFVGPVSRLIVYVRPPVPGHLPGHAPQGSGFCGPVSSEPGRAGVGAGER
ncbi:MAG: hypothetical protein NVS3B18_15720 [Candidatus Dormibacteria bacterium]